MTLQEKRFEELTPEEQRARLAAQFAEDFDLERLLVVRDLWPDVPWPVEQAAVVDQYAARRQAALPDVAPKASPQVVGALLERARGGRPAWSSSGFRTAAQAAARDGDWLRVFEVLREMAVAYADWRAELSLYAHARHMAGFPQLVTPGLGEAHPPDLLEELGRALNGGLGGTRAERALVFGREVS